MRQILLLVDVLRGLGTAILVGFRRFLSTMCFFVVRVNQMGSDVASSPPSESARRFCFPDAFEASFSAVLTYFKSAVDALRT